MPRINDDLGAALADLKRTHAAVRDHAQSELEALTHLFMLNRGVLLTPFHSMMLVSPATTLDDVALLLAVFDELLAALRALPARPATAPASRSA